jgi:hypothetical protein
MAMDKEKLRKADLVTSVLIFVFGAWVLAMAFEMPMKDSFGGVMNVWYVSPALFPIFVGVALMVLAVVLFAVALPEVGRENAVNMVRRVFASRPGQKRLSDGTWRFIAIVVLLLAYVYISIPWVDFFLGTLLFLFVFITIFYFDDDVLLRKLFGFYFSGTVLFLLYIVAGGQPALDGRFEYGTDALALVFLVAYGGYCWYLVRSNPVLRKKYRLSIIVTVATPAFLCPVFKYFLLVPLPKEGAVVALMDFIRYSMF